MNKLTIKNTIVELFIGELINSEYDAIILPTNSRLLPSGELRCKTLRKAGPEVQVECNKIIQTISNIPAGEAIMTSGGNLESKYLIHARAGYEGKKLMLATWNSLKIADENALRSIVFPPILKEIIGFNTKKCAEIMLPTIEKYLNEKNTNLENVSICLETLPDYKDFEAILERISN